MKYFIIFLVLILLLTTYYFYSLYNSLEIKTKVKKVYAKNILKNQLNIVIDILINNKSSKSITIKDFYIEVYFSGELIAKTLKSNNEIFIGPNVKDFIALKDLSIDFVLKDAAIKLASNYLSKVPLQLTIKFKASVFFLPISASTVYIYNDY